MYVPSLSLSPFLLCVANPRIPEVSSCLNTFVSCASIFLTSFNNEFCPITGGNCPISPKNIVGRLKDNISLIILSLIIEHSSITINFIVEGKDLLTEK